MNDLVLIFALDATNQEEDWISHITRFVQYVLPG